MKILPSEILGEIFLHLHQSDKLACMLVCHHWNEIVQEFALYHTLFIHNRSTQFMIEQQMQKTPEVLNKVERVIFCVGYRFEPADPAKLFQRLPNLKITINFNNPIFVRTIEYSSRSRTEYILDYFNTTIPYKVLLSNKCPSVTRLCICCNSEDMNFVQFYSALKNAPALKHLETTNFTLKNMHQLDTIHESAPNLKIIKFNSVKFTGDNTFRWNNMPATPITGIFFQLVPLSSSADKLLNLLKYVCKKFPNISELTFRSDNSDYLTGDERNTINQNGWTPLLKGLGPQLKKLTINKDVCIENVFALLDQCGCQIHYLDLDILGWYSYYEMVLSKQTRYIQTLVIHYRHNNRHFGTFDWSNQFKAINKVEIHCHAHKMIKFSRIFLHPGPSITTLSINNAALRFYPDETPLSNITTLILNQVIIPYDIDEFVSKHLPKLSNLTLKRCDIYKNIFDIEPLNLQYFHFGLFGKEYGYNLLVSTHNNNEKRMYVLAGTSMKTQCYERLKFIDKYTPYHPFTSYPVNADKIKSDFSFICNSVRNVELI